jgi:hypothetical protein
LPQRTESPLSDAVRDRVASSLPGCNKKLKEGLAQAIAVTAVRETYEEAGIACGSVRAGERPCLRILTRTVGSSSVVVPRLDKVRYLGRSVTPSHLPIRFAARIFAVDADDAGVTGMDGGTLWY